MNDYTSNNSLRKSVRWNKKFSEDVHAFWTPSYGYLNSSFYKFVKNGLYDINWGSNTDIKEIIDLDFE